MNKTELREYLIQHLDNCLVPYKKWCNRDTPSAQEGQAIMRMYLRAGCDFKLMSSYDTQVSVKAAQKFLENCEGTMYVSILHYDFEDEGTWHTSYTPSPNSLKFNKEHNQDWY